MIIHNQCRIKGNCMGALDGCFESPPPPLLYLVTRYKNIPSEKVSGIGFKGNGDVKSKGARDWRYYI